MSATTVTVTVTAEVDADAGPSSADPAAPQHLTLRLRKRRRVRFSEETVDNEEMCRKKSKCCCIYHAPRGDAPPADSDDEADIARDCDPEGEG